MSDSNVSIEQVKVAPVAVDDDLVRLVMVGHLTFEEANALQHYRSQVTDE